MCNSQLLSIVTCIFLSVYAMLFYNNHHELFRNLIDKTHKMRRFPLARYLNTQKIFDHSILNLFPHLETFCLPAFCRITVGGRPTYTHSGLTQKGFPSVQLNTAYDQHNGNDHTYCEFCLFRI